jgi:hypothetical protein
MRIFIGWQWETSDKQPLLIHVSLIRHARCIGSLTT